MSPSIYHFWAPLYDALFAQPLARARRRAVEALVLRPGERVLLPGVGTGLDLPMVPPGTYVVGGDLSQAMLGHARRKGSPAAVRLLRFDAQTLPFADATFDAVALHLIVSVVPDGARAMGEASRVLRPGGRAVIFDKFLPEGGNLSPIRRAAGRLLRALGTDPNRRLSDLLTDLPHLHIVRNEAVLLGEQYRLVLLHKLA